MMKLIPFLAKNARKNLKLKYKKGRQNKMKKICLNCKYGKYVGKFCFKSGLEVSKPSIFYCRYYRKKEGEKNETGLEKKEQTD